MNVRIGLREQKRLEVLSECTSAGVDMTWDWRSFDNIVLQTGALGRLLTVRYGCAARPSDGVEDACLLTYFLWQQQLALRAKRS